MAEFWCFIERFKQQDQDFKGLYSKLQAQQDECLQNIETISKQLKDYQSVIGNDKCFKDKNAFDKYLNVYSLQFVEKGVSICEKSIEDELNGGEQTRGKAKLQCLNFYHNNLLVFKDNVIRKLTSLTDQSSLNML